MKSVVIFVFCLVEAVVGQGSVSTPAGTLKYDEDWGYVQVRQSAHTFWWLFTVKTDPTRPLILWLQGGPGSDSTGFGNLDEIGPKDVTLKDRNSTWLQIGDLVFVDNPVGAGFSYVDDSSAFTTNVQQIGADLLVWAKAFFGKKHPEYQNRNFYIACESYGGKMTAEFAKQLQDAIDDGVIKAKLGGVLLGDSWISPIDFVNTWGPYLHAVSYLDDKQLTTANAKADECQKLVDNQQWYDSTVCWGEIEGLIGDLTAGVSWYNILKAGGSDDWSKKKFLKTNKMAKKSGPLQRLYDNHVGQFRLDAVSDLMDGQMRKKFGIIPNQIRFGAQSGAVFNKQYGDFMKPNYNTVDNLLNRGVNVTIVNGQLDLICNTLGVELWLKRLSWSGRDTFLASQKNSYAPTNENKVYGFWKQYKNLKMYYILRSGHMYGHDAPWATLEALKTVFK